MGLRRIQILAATGLVATMGMTGCSGEKSELLSNSVDMESLQEDHPEIHDRIVNWEETVDRAVLRRDSNIRQEPETLQMIAILNFVGAHGYTIDEKGRSTAPGELARYWGDIGFGDRGPITVRCDGDNSEKVKADMAKEEVTLDDICGGQDIDPGTLQITRQRVLDTLPPVQVEGQSNTLDIK